MLGVPPSQVFAVSAQKALLAKVNGDDALLARSRLPRARGRAVAASSFPAKRDIVGAATQSRGARARRRRARDPRRARRAASPSSWPSCTALRGKNQDVVEHMMERVREEKELFERGLARFTALRNVFTQQTNELFDHIGLEALRANAGAHAASAIEDSPFTKGVRGAMNDFFAQHPRRLRRARRGSRPRSTT